MKNRYDILLVVLGALSLQSYALDTTICKGLKDGVLIPSTVGERFFYICQENIAYEMECPVGFLFCSAAGKCTRTCSIPAVTNPTTVATTAKPTVTTATTVTVTTAKPTVTTTKPTVTTIKATEPTTKATVTTPKATVTTTKPTTPAPTVCTGQVDGTIFPDPKNCAGYFLCKTGKIITGACDFNYSYDKITGTCINKVCKN